MKLGVITRRGQRKREIEMFSKNFETIVYEIAENLPVIIENPGEYINLPADFKPDILVSFAAHPDLNLEILKQAAERGVKLVIFSGRTSGSYRQLKEEGEKRGVKVLWEEVCCTTPKLEDFEFFEHFGAPELEIEIEERDGKKFVKDVKVKRAAFCGATFFVAEKLKGIPIEEAPAKAGYFTQIFPCLASLGPEGGIHKAAMAHKKAVEKALAKERKAEASRNYMKYRFVDHTADIAFEVYGNSERELLENAAMAFYDAFIDLSKVEVLEEKIVEVEGEDIDQILYRWLNELLFLLDTEFFAGKEVEVSFGKKVVSKIRGGKVSREAIKVQPKAITMHKFGVKKENGKLSAFVVVDI